MLHGIAAFYTAQMRPNDAEFGKGFGNRRNLFRRRVDNIRRIGVAPGVKQKRKAQFLQLLVDGQRLFLTHKKFLIIRVELYTLEPNLLDAFQLRYGILCVRMNRAEK